MQAHVVVNAVLDPCTSDSVKASSQLFVRNYVLNADSRVNLTDYTNVRSLASLDMVLLSHLVKAHSIRPRLSEPDMLDIFGSARKHC